jgi:hypothetical protein
VPQPYDCSGQIRTNVIVAPHKQESIQKLPDLARLSQMIANRYDNPYQLMARKCGVFFDQQCIASPVLLREE